MAKSLNELRDEALAIAVKNGFTEASVGEDLALIHSEVSEALEDYRNGAEPNETWYEDFEYLRDIGGYIQVDGNGKAIMVPVRSKENWKNTLKPCGIPSELADIVIRVLHFAGKHGIDIDRAVAEKMAYNATREPKHGGKKL